MALSKEDREQFLSQPHIAALSVDAGPGRGPLTVPIWYQYEPGGEPWVMTAAHSRKAQLIEAAGHFSLMVERTEPTLRYVCVEGAVSRIEPGTEEQHAELAYRYLPRDRADRFLQFAHAELGTQVVIYLRPQHWLSSDMGAV